jgi:toxin CcdB
MQHDLFANPAVRTRHAFPFIVVLQADIAGEGRGRIVAPLAPRRSMPDAVGRLLPIVRHNDTEFLLALELMTTVPVTALRQRLGSIAQHRDDIARALDWLFTGV